MYAIIIILIVLASILMSLIVLIQASKGGGLASGFASSNQIMGVRKTTDVIEKTTWGLAIAMVVLSVAAAYALPKQNVDSSVLMKTNTTAPVPTVPQQGAPTTMPTGGNAQQQAPAPEGGQQ